MTARNKKFWNNRNVLVTGHEGFLGSWLAKQLAQEGANIVGVDRVSHRPGSILDDVRDKIRGIQGDVANFNLLKELIEEFKPQTIFHIAAQAIVGEANKNPLETFHSNIQGTWTLLEAARQKKFVEAIVVASSDKAYGSHAKLPYHEDASLHGEHPYDVSKSCTDLLCRSYFLSFGVPVCVTRCGNIYGPGDPHFSRLIPDAIQHVLNEEQFVIRSSGQFTRDYIFVKDIVEAYLLLAEKMKVKKLAGEAFNFSCEKPLTVLDVFDTIVGLSGKRKLKPKILNQANGEIKHQYLSSRKAQRILGWRAEYALKDGLIETIEWYQSNLTNGLRKRAMHVQVGAAQ